MPSGENSGALPRPLTSFVGRERELDELGTLLADPTCRLITLVGPGGIGKTRLALAAVAAHGEYLPDGVTFVNLQPIDEPDFLAPAIADALGLPLTGRGSPFDELTHFLTGRRALLVLDNFEQLLAAADQLSTLLHASGVRLLVTSREALRLREEWLYPLEGLALEGTEREQGAAVRLFAERATRVQPRFSLEGERESVEAICRLVEGMPLAIELAAAWSRSLSSTEIAAEIERDLAFLSSPLRNLPERHRSLATIFERSWARLAPEARAIFRRLSVFRGGFRQAAAHAVAGATLPQLSALIDRSLLRWERSEGGPFPGRYQIHELLRQFAAEQLDRDPEEAAEARARHARYYCDFLARRESDLVGGRQPEATAEIDAEIDNVRAAWRWASEQGALDELDRALLARMNYFWFRARFREASDGFALAIHHVRALPTTPERDATLAGLLIFLASHLMVLGEMARSDAAAHESQQLHESLGIAPRPGTDTDPRFILSINARWRGEYELAADYAQAALAESLDRPHLHNEHFAHRLLGDIHLELEELEVAHTHACHALELVQKVNDLSGIAYTQDLLGAIAAARQDYDAAARHYQVSYELRGRLGFDLGRADVLQKLGAIALQREAYEEAAGHLERCLPIFQEVNITAGEIETRALLARVEIGRGAPMRGHEQLRQAIALLADPIEPVTAQLLYLMLVGGELQLTLGYPVVATELLARLDGAIFRPEDRATLEALLARCRTALGARRYAAARARGQARSREAHFAALVAFLSAPPTTAPSHSPPQPLVEPLTPREFEVLQHMAAGLTNQQIADELIISVGTVKSYTSQIYGKLGVSRRTQAVIYAREIGLLT